MRVLIKICYLLLCFIYLYVSAWIHAACMHVHGDQKTAFGPLQPELQAAVSCSPRSSGRSASTLSHWTISSGLREPLLLALISATLLCGISKSDEDKHALSLLAVYFLDCSAAKTFNALPLFLCPLSIMSYKLWLPLAMRSFSNIHLHHRCLPCSPH